MAHEKKKWILTSSNQMGLDFSLSLCFVFICFVAGVRFFLLFHFYLYRFVWVSPLYSASAFCLRSFVAIVFVSISSLDDTRWKSTHRSDGRNREMTTATTTTISTTITTVSLMEKGSALSLQSDSVFGVMDIFIGKLRIIFPVGENYTPHKTANSDCVCEWVWLDVCAKCDAIRRSMRELHTKYIFITLSPNDVEWRAR